ncbi:MAG: sugar ABC transporter ATP-binding protein [Candidatus Velthaea sp.]|jgi:ribose transport system ATP-binding protein
MNGIGKTFGGVIALRDVDFALRAGEIHGLVGENGAGKSTLMKIIAGVHAEHDGTMRVNGREAAFRSASDALAAGIGMVHQELSVVPELTVAENVFLGTQPTTKLGVVDWPFMFREAHQQLSQLGIDVNVRATMGTLPLGVQQLIELGRVLFSGAEIIILDEPTSALSPPEIKRLFDTLRHLRETGKSIIFISHFLDDVLAVCDTVTVFRNGRKIATMPCAHVDKHWVIESMIGTGHEDLEESYTSERRLEAPPDGPIVLESEGLSKLGAFSDVSLNVRAGEVLGIYGFMGSGQLEFARALFGKIVADAGTIRVAGKTLRARNTAAAKRAGIALVPESRRSMLFALEPVFKNVSISILERLSAFLLRPAAERRIAQEHVTQLHIRPPHVELPLGTLSGGNQQKVALAKWLAYVPKVLVLCEPTRGMDVGAKDDVVKIVRGLRDAGMAVIVVSTEPETVLSLADRIVVMKKGCVVREFTNEAVSKDRLLGAA